MFKKTVALKFGTKKLARISFKKILWLCVTPLIVIIIISSKQKLRHKLIAENVHKCAMLMQLLKNNRTWCQWNSNVFNSYWKLNKATDVSVTCGGEEISDKIPEVHWDEAAEELLSNGLSQQMTCEHRLVNDLLAMKQICAATHVTILCI